jgi:hypothetical protein
VDAIAAYVAELGEPLGCPDLVTLGDWRRVKSTAAGAAAGAPIAAVTATVAANAPLLAPATTLMNCFPL